MRFLKWLLIALVSLALVAGVYGLWTVRRSYPTIDGEISVAGLDAATEVIRDEWGIPHIYASTSHDLFFTQGYTHAQERFWQMDFWRHIGSARLSEMFGAGQVDTDRFLRSLGFSDLARQELGAMDPASRAVLESYADGVNAYLAGRSGPEISLEYAILPLQSPGYVIEPWTPENTLTWAKLMSWDLSGNMRSEIERAVLSVDLPPSMVEELFPFYPDDHPVIVPGDQEEASAQSNRHVPEEAMPALVSAGAAAERVWALTGGGFEGIGSNNWAIGGDLTESGLPVLANDPHLAPQMPSIWFANGLHCTDPGPECPYQLVGFSFAGTPGVIIGHNEAIAWGVTTQAVDTQDLFIERVNPANPGQYEADGAWVDFEMREEVIRVAGEDDVTHRVFSTRHGPVISGTFLEDGELDGSAALDLPDEYVVALAWQSLEPSTLVEAVLGINEATDYDEFREAASLWDIAAQNIVYADIDGNIAYQSTGEVPIRAAGDGRYPVPGWDGGHEWVDLVPYEQMPRLLNPPRGYVATANQQVLPTGSLPFLTADGAYGYRADRIETLIVGDEIHGPETSRLMQMDNWDGGAESLVPALLTVPDDGDGRVGIVQSWLRAWQGGSEEYQASPTSASAAIYQAVWRELLASTFHDQLPEEHWPVGGSRWFAVVADLVQDPDSDWWDDVRTEGKESMEDIMYRSMRAAYDELVEQLGDDPDSWSWGQLHIAHFDNQTLGRSGIPPVEWLFNRTAPEVVGGGASIINANGWTPYLGFQVDWVPSMRMVIDLSDLSNSTYIHTTGNSGHAFHDSYDNMLESWARGDQAPMHWTREQIMGSAVTTLTLSPAED